MLVINKALAARGRVQDDRGAALVAVLIVMAVGVIAAALVAASVLFTIRTNATNKNSTQAFIAAESGRDKMLAEILAHPCNLALTDAAAPPLYYAVSATVSPATAAGCLDVSASAKQTTITITASGKDTSGGNATITSVYQRPIEGPSPGGTMSYFEGQFKATKSSYDGDLVVRDGDFRCNSGSTLVGNLWVVNGAVDLGSSCVVTGSVYVGGTVQLKASNASIGGSVYATGDVDLSSTGGQIGTKDGSGNLVAGTGDVYTDTALSISGTTVLGKYITGLGVTGATAANVIGLPASISNCKTAPAVTPPAACTTRTPGTERITPTLARVSQMTTWLELSTAQAPWGTDVDWRDACGTNAATLWNKIVAAPTAPKTRVGIYYGTATCSAAGQLTFSASGNLDHDVVVLVPSGKPMIIDTGGTTLQSSNGSSIFFVRADKIPTNNAPDCGSSANTDSVKVNGGSGVKVFFYSPCGIASTGHLAFTGEFYTNNDGGHWVWPDFTCTPMKWLPTLSLGCTVKDTAPEVGHSSTMLLPPSLLSQTETG